MQRFLPISGVIAGVFALLAILLTGSEPDSDASTAKIVAFYSDHKTPFFLSSVAGLFAVLFLAFFIAALRSTLRSGEPEESSYSTVVTVGGTLLGAGIAVACAMGAAIVKAVDVGLPAESIRTLHVLSSYDWMPMVLGIAALMIPFGIGGLRTAAVPKSLSWISIVVGVIACTPAGVIAYFVLPFWLIGTGIVLARGERVPAVAAAPATA